MATATNRHEFCDLKRVIFIPSHPGGQKSELSTTGQNQGAGRAHSCQWSGGGSAPVPSSLQTHHCSLRPWSQGLLPSSHSHKAPVTALPSSEGRQNENHSHRKLTKLVTWTTALSNSMKLWAMTCRATRDRRVTVESSDKHGPLEKGMESHFSIPALRTPWTVWKGKNDMTLKDELPRLVGAQHAPRKEWRNNSRKNEGTERKWKQWPAADVTGDGSKDAVKSNTAQEPGGMLGPWIKGNWRCSDRRWQEWTSTF